MTQRRSDKHNPRIDRELESETASMTHGAPVPARTRADLRQEDPAEDTHAPAAPDPGVPPGMSALDVELRSQLARALRPSIFPAGRDRLVEVAREEYASQAFIAALGRLPAGRVYQVLEEVAEDLGERGEDSSRRF